MFSDYKSFLILFLCAWMPAFAIWRFAGRSGQSKKQDSESPQKRMGILPLLPFGGGIFLSLAIFQGAPIFFSDPLLTASYILAGSVLLTVLLDLVAEYCHPVTGARKETGKKTAAAFPIALVGIASFLAVFCLRSMPGSKRDARNMTIPFRGKWRVITGGRFKFMNYHHGNPDTQNYAVDFVKVGPGEASRGQKIFAPVSGAVAKSVGDLKEGRFEPPEGNIVILETTDGIRVWLCHLQEGSVKVQEGDRVKAGDEIAASGASGGADVPHLHLHAERDGKAVPILLGKGRAFPIRGDVVSPDLP